MKLSFRVLPLALLSLLFTACADDATGPQSTSAVALAVLSGDEQTAAAGAPVGVVPSVRALDSRNRPVSGVVVSFEVTQGDGSVTNSSQMTDADGVATAGSWTLGQKTGSYALIASAPGLRAAAFNATAVAAAPASLLLKSIATQSATVGTQVLIPPTIEVRDQFGNTVADVVVTFALASGGGSISGAVATTSASGTASLGSWTLGNIAGVNTVTAAVTGVTPIVISASGTAGFASSLAISAGNNQSATAALSVPVNPVVIARDAFGNPVAGVPVTFSVASGGGATSGSFAVTGLNGLASVGSWTLGAATGENTLTAKSGSLAAVTFVANAISGSASALSIADGNNQVATVGANVAVSPKILVRDSNGNPVAGISVGFQVTAGGGSVGNGVATTNAQGVATLASWTMGTVAGANSISASASGAAPIVMNATAVAGAAVLMTKIAGDNAIEPAGTGTVDPTVLVRDALGNPVPNVPVSFVITGGNGTADNLNVVTNAAGIARVSRWTVGTVAGINTMRASTGALPSVTFTVNGIAGPAARLLKTAGDQQSAMVASVVPINPVVTVTDRFGNVIAGVAIAFNVASTSGSVTTVSSTTGSDGRATAGSWRLGTIPGTHTLNVTADFAPTAGSGPNSTLFTATARAGDPFVLEIFAGNSQSALIGSTLPVRPAVRVRDMFGNPVPDANVLFTVIGGGGITTGSSALTNNAGVATVGNWTIGPVAGSNSLRAAVNGVAPIVFSASGNGPLVAVGGIGSGGTIRTSLDGLSWTEQSSPLTGLATSVAYNGSMWLVGAEGAQTMARSTNATTWTTVANPLTANVAGIAWNGSMWVAVGTDAAGVSIATSPDGTTWTPRASPFSSPTSFGMSVAWNGSVWVAGGSANGGDPGFATSPDGITWTARPGPFTIMVRSVTWNGSLFVATGVGGAMLATSPDGITWTARAVPFTAAGFAAAWNGNMWVAGGGFDPASSIATSPDGINWTAQATAFNGVTAVTWTGAMWVALGRDAGAVPIAGVSLDGITWTTAPIGFSALATSVGWTNPIFPPF